MKKAEELYMKHIYATGEIPNKRENLAPTEVTINEVDSPQRTRDYTHRRWRNRESSEISPNQPKNPETILADRVKQRDLTQPRRFSRKIQTFTKRRK